MLDVFILQWKRLIKRPLLLISFTALTVVFVFFMGGARIEARINVPVYSEELPAAEVQEWVDILNADEDSSIIFEHTDYEAAERSIRMNNIPFAMEITDETYRFLAGREAMELPVVNQYVNQVYREQTRLREVQAEFPDAEIEVEEFITVKHTSIADMASVYNEFQLTTLVGMTLYSTVFTIMFFQIYLVEEKRLGTWNRLIFSPLSKTQIYLGHLLFYFTVGVLQIALSFAVLVNLLGIDIGTNYLPMITVALAFVFSIVSLGILVAALSPTVQSLQVIIPIIATSMAMLGGAFWPLEIVSNRILLFLSDLMPIKHGAEGMIDAAMRNYTFSDLAQPIGILLLMGILFMGIGINLMERVSKQ